jgi:Family of unknown function (DUF6130)
MQIGETAHGLALMRSCCSQKFRRCVARHRSQYLGLLHSIPTGVRMKGEAIDGAPKLIVDPPLPGPLAQGLFQAQYRVENVRILPVFGPGALNASPRLGHLHINVDDLPWLWADASDSNTIDIAGLPPGEHKVKIELVDANHQIFTGCSTCRQTVTFTVSGSAARH